MLPLLHQQVYILAQMLLIYSAHLNMTMNMKFTGKNDANSFREVVEKA